MKPVIPNLNNGDEQYVSLDFLLDYFKENLAIPFKASFSFIPFLNKMKARMAINECEVTANMLPKIEELDQHLSNNNGVIDETAQSGINALTNAMLPSLFFEGEYSFVCPPFSKSFAYATPNMHLLREKDKWLVKYDLEAQASRIITPLQQATILILNKFYNQNIDELTGDVITVKNVETNLEQHFKMNMRHDFIEIKLAGELPELNDETIYDIINNLSDKDKILSYLPIDRFSFSGFGIGQFTDVTELEIQSQIKDLASNIGYVDQDEFTSYIQNQLRNFFRRTDLDVGVANIIFEGAYAANNKSISKYKKFHKYIGSANSDEKLNSYQKAYCSGMVVIEYDLKSIPKPAQSVQGLINNGYQSVVLIPIKDNSGKVTSVLELGSSKKYAFTSMDVINLEPIVKLLNTGNDLFLRDLNNKINQYIKNQYTSIHPSVEWKFEEIATKHEVKKGIGEFDDEIEEIVFKDVYPIYGQADIVNSSVIRNEAIQHDLIFNLNLLIDLFKGLEEINPDFHLIDAYLLKTEETLRILEVGYTSSLESYILEMLSKELHPFLKQLSLQFGHQSSVLIKQYFNQLSKDLGVVYQHRQAYELSVSKLNQTIALYLEKEDIKLQDSLPHYFEKYKTDGVEYNIYLGQSILKEGVFSLFHLKDFRLWQLINLCEITKLVHDLQDTMPVPLTTAQLIFVYSSSLSIRFRMDEKQFDVDGTYNVRYEILKKRIDKAVIKDTEERLTQAGKIAIVYLLEKDRKEYLEYINYLVNKGLIKPSVEDLELEKLQGADGLKALRIEPAV